MAHAVRRCRVPAGPFQRKSASERSLERYIIVSTPQDCLNAETPALEAASNLLVIIHTLDQTASVQEVSRGWRRVFLLSLNKCVAGYTSFVDCSFRE